MCTVLLPPGGYPIAVNKYIISYHIYHYSSIAQMPDKNFSQFCDIGNLSRYLEILMCCFARFLAEPLRGRCDVTPSLNIHAVKLKRTDRCSTYVIGNVRYCSADRTLVTPSLIIFLARHVSSPSVRSVTPTLLGPVTRNAATLSGGPDWL